MLIFVNFAWRVVTKIETDDAVDGKCTDMAKRQCRVRMNYSLVASQYSTREQIKKLSSSTRRRSHNRRVGSDAKREKECS